MFVVVSGKIRIEQGGQKITELGPSDWLGEMALLSEGKRTATATATEPTRAFVVAHREFHALMDQMPSVRAAVYECVAERIRELETEKAH